MIILASFKFLERSFIWTFNDKLLHFVAYAILAGLIFLGWRNKTFLPRLVHTLLILGVLGALDEGMAGRAFVAGHARRRSMQGLSPGT